MSLNTTSSPGYRLLTVSRSSSTVNNIKLAYTLIYNDAIRCLGSSLNLSFLALKGSAFSASGSTLNIRVYCSTYSTSDVSYFNANFNNSFTALSAGIILSTGLNQYTFNTSAIPTNTRQIAITFDYTSVGATYTNDSFSLANLQLEVGTNRTNYCPERYTTELTECLYYTQLVTGAQGLVYTGGTSNAQLCIQFSSPLRTAPVKYAYLKADKSTSTNVQITDTLANYTSTSAVSATSVNDLGGIITIGGFTGLTSYRPVQLNPASGGFHYILVDAELY